MFFSFCLPWLSCIKLSSLTIFDPNMPVGDRFFRFLNATKFCIRSNSAVSVLHIKHLSSSVLGQFAMFLL